MSLLVGFYHTDFSIAEERTLRMMYEGVEHFPHEKAAFLRKKNAAFGHLLTYNTPEALFEEMPQFYTEEGASLLFVAEARLDNREELANALGIRLSPTLSDGAIILKAYLKWGKTTPEKLLGDWSFACFDETTQELFIARDQHGYTSIFYHYEANTFSFASSKKSLLALPHVKRMANQEQIIRGLALRFITRLFIKVFFSYPLVIPLRLKMVKFS
jgi:asparagine synthase (glutamine-hydrolysing)